MRDSHGSSSSEVESPCVASSTSAPVRSGTASGGTTRGLR